MGRFKLNNLRKNELNENFSRKSPFSGQKPCAGARQAFFLGDGGHLRSKNPNL